MIIHDPNLMRLAIDPLEDHSPLIVDPDRVKILQVALELLPPIRWRYRQSSSRLAALTASSLRLALRAIPSN
jgi:hypothetical protein